MLGVTHGPNGTWAVFGFDAGNTGRIYELVAGAWVERSTGTAGDKFGATRFGSSTALCSLVWVEDKFTPDTSITSLLAPKRLVIQNGEANEEPRVFGIRATHFEQVARHKQLNAPLRQYCSAEPTFDQELDLVSATITDSTAAQFDGAVPSQGWYRLKCLASCTSGDTSIIDLAAAVAYAPAINSQLQILWDDNSSGAESWSDPFNDLKVEVTDTGGSYIVIWDPTDPGAYEAPVYVPAEDGAYLTAFRIPAQTWTTVDKIRFTYVGANRGALDPVLEMRAFRIGLSGAVQGGSQFAVSFISTQTLSESGAVVCLNAQAGLTSAIGNTYRASEPEGGSGLPPSREPQRGKTRRIPDSPLVSYAYNVIFPLPVSTEVTSKYADYAVVYIKGFDGLEFLQLDSAHPAIANRVTGANTVFTVLGADYLKQTHKVRTDDTIKRKAPDGDTLAMPVGKVLEKIPGRSVVGQVRYNASDTESRPEIWTSDFRHPFRFRFIVADIDGESDPDSGTRVQAPGETIMGFAAMAGTLIGVDGLLVFSDEQFYSLDGVDALQLSRMVRLGPHGTRAPRSIAVHHNRVFWLDQEKVVRTYGVGVEALSVNTVENYTDNIDFSVDLPVAAFWKDRYYLSFRDGESYRNRTLVFDTRLGGWSTDLHPAANRSPANWFTGVDTAGTWMLWLVTPDGTILQAEKPGQLTDNGTAFVSALFSREIQAPTGLTLSFMDMILQCTKHASQSFTTGRRLRGAAADSGVGSLSLVTTGNSIFRRDVGAADQYLGVDGEACQFKLSGSVDGGLEILSLWAMIEQRDQGEDVA